MSRRRRVIWSPAVEQWIAELKDAALESAADTAARARRYVVDLKWHTDQTRQPDDERRHRAAAELDAIETSGAEPIMRRWFTARHGYVAVPAGRRRVRKTRAGGHEVRSTDGTVEHQLALFELMTFAQLREVLLVEQATVTGHLVRVTQLGRLLELQAQTELPDTATPAQAAQQLGMTVDEWIERGA